MDSSSIDEIADGIYRISTCLPGVIAGHDITVNSFLVMADEPLLFHTGIRPCFPAMAAALGRVLPVARLRWLSFGHVEADECGAMNDLLAAAPDLQVAFGALGCTLSLDDMADRPPRRLAPGEALDLGGRRVVVIDTPHVPHNIDAQVLYEETTGVLLCGDLFTQLGRGPAVTGECLVEAALDAEDVLNCSVPGEGVPQALDRLADLEPQTLAIMHGSSYEGEGGRALRELAAAWRARLPTPTGERVAAGWLAG
jgi:flavorubredoxin